MKRHFVLDENVIALAATETDPRGQPDPTSYALIDAILRHCHSLVFGERTWGRYCHQIANLSRQRVPMNRQFMALLTGLLYNAEKDIIAIPDDQLKQIEGLEQLKGVDEGDAEFVRIAASVTGSILVTMDGPLIQVLTQQQLDREHGFNLGTAADVLTMAGPS